MDPKLAAQLREIAEANKAVHEENTQTLLTLQDRLNALEQKGAVSNLDMRTGGMPTLVETVTKAEGWNAFASGNSPVLKVALAAGQLDYVRKTAIVNATGQNQPLVPAHRVPGIVYEPARRLFMREMLPSSPTNSNLIEFTKENVFTNNAGPQYSSPARENVTKNESGITFTLATAPVVTMAHWIPASKQVMEDSAALAAYLGPRMLYGLALKTDNAILNGDGTGGTLDGILKAGNFVAYNRGVSGDTPIDTIGRALTQLALTDYAGDAVVLNPADWETIRHEKDNDGNYICGNPSDALEARLWGCRVVVTNQITAGTFLVGAFAMGAHVYDRQQATVELSRHDGSNFVKNAITILAEERLALAIYRPKAFVSGSF